MAYCQPLPPLHILGLHIFNILHRPAHLSTVASSCAQCHLLRHQFAASSHLPHPLPPPLIPFSCASSLSALMTHCRHLLMIISASEASSQYLPPPPPPREEMVDGGEENPWASISASAQMYGPKTYPRGAAASSASFQAQKWRKLPIVCKTTPGMNPKRVFSGM